MVDIKWPPAILPLVGSESIPMLQGNKLVGAPSSAVGSGGGGGGPAGAPVVNSYAAIRANVFPQATALILNDPYKGGVFVPDPTNHRDDGGLYIKDAGGNTWVRTGWERVNAAWYYDCAGHHLGDGTAIGITSADIAANPEWLGLPNYTPPGNNVPLGPYPVGTTWDYVALQQCFYACFASKSTPGNVVWGNSIQTDNLPMWVPKGNMNTNQGLYAEVSGCDIYCATKAGSKIIYNGGLGARPAVTFNAMSYGSVHNLTVYAPNACPVIVSLDYTGAAGSHGLATQQLSMYDWFVSGGTIWDQIGVGIGVQGGSTAQGDTIVFVNPIVTSCGKSGFYANGFNALSIMILEGDVQGCMRDGVSAGPGSFLIYGTSFQAQAAYFGQAYPQRLQINYFGGDVHYLGGDGGGSTVRVMSDVRSEGDVLYLCESYVGGQLRNCGIAGADWGSWQPTTTAALGLIAQTGGSINTDVELVDDGGPQWFNSAAGTTATVIQVPGTPGWTVNQWAGRPVWLWWNNTFLQPTAVVSNTANTLTISPGFPAGLPLVGTPVKITGSGGATAPAWDTFAPGLSFEGSFAPGFGFSTTAGSNVISTNDTTGLSVGMYAMVTAAAQIVDGNGTPPVRGALMGKIGSINTGVSPHTFTLVDATGAPINAAETLTDRMGYAGPAITDGQLTWMPLDWDTVVGPSVMDNMYLPRGKGRHVGQSTFLGGYLPSNFFRGDAVANILEYNNSGDQGFLGQLTGSVIGAVTLTQVQINASRSFQFWVTGNTTFNLPHMGNSEARIRLFLQAQVVSPVITWGTNIKAVAPTLTLGAGGFLMTVVDLVWTTNPNAAAWYVTNIQGPM